jgi:hypothetical protein
MPIMERMSCESTRPRHDAQRPRGIGEAALTALMPSLTVDIEAPPSNWSLTKTPLDAQPSLMWVESLGILGI